MVEHYYNAEDYSARRSIGYLIRHGSNLLMSQVEGQFADSDITFIQYIILMLLREKLAFTSADLCQTLRYDSGAITRVIDSLEKKKLIKRQRSTRDRRVVRLRLLARGNATAESVIPLVVQKYNHWLKDFTQEEADTLVRLLTKLNATICGDNKCGS